MSYLDSTANSECPASTCAPALHTRGDVGGGRQAAHGAALRKYNIINALILTLFPLAASVSPTRSPPSPPGPSSATSGGLIDSLGASAGSTALPVELVYDYPVAAGAANAVGQGAIWVLGYSLLGCEPNQRRRNV
ncbi:hypothetical protein DFH08DRAFT_963877 [Mycena albidolilacea]|uniref:Uncharacterized protein n=1 Tax=Mycena albidolilacea TaxID=1033008 RepID=A0AAD7EMD7_9AGAR|nr:hypothetical protein DFH08DRAFT_963877 [Mycena albidolilacea]